MYQVFDPPTPKYLSGLVHRVTAVGAYTTYSNHLKDRTVESCGNIDELILSLLLGCYIYILWTLLPMKELHRWLFPIPSALPGIVRS